MAVQLIDTAQYCTVQCVQYYIIWLSSYLAVASEQPQSRNMKLTLPVLWCGVCVVVWLVMGFSSGMPSFPFPGWAVQSQGPTPAPMQAWTRSLTPDP